MLPQNKLNVVPRQYSLLRILRLCTSLKMFPIPISRATIRQFGAVIPVLCGSLLYGFGNGWSGSAFHMLASKNSTVKATIADVSLLVSLCYIGNMAVTLCFLTFFNNCSRKLLIFLNLTLNTVSWTINLFATDIYLLFLSASICGLACGIYDLNTRQYLSEVCSSSNRGLFGALSYVCYIFATELSFVLDVFDSLLVLSVVPLVISISAMLTWFMIEESPYYLAMNGRIEESIRVLLYLNDRVEEKFYQEEMATYCHDKHATSSLSYLKESENTKLYVTVVVINTMLYTSSFAVFFAYDRTLLNSFTIDLHKLQYIIPAGTIIFALLVLTVLKFGRSYSLIWIGFIMLTVIQLCLGILFSIAKFYKLRYVGQIIVMYGLLYFWVYLSTVYPAIYVLRSEIFPSKLKNEDCDVLVIFKTAVEFIVSITFFPIILVVDVRFNFYIYIICAAAGALFMHKVLKTTQGKTLVEI